MGGIIFNQEGSVLLIRRKKPPEKGKWSIPGGVVQTGEKLHEALKREIVEECMLNIEVGPILSVSSRIIKSQSGKVRYHYIIVDYLCEYQGGEPEARTDAGDVRWVPVDAINRCELTEGLSEVIMKGWKKQRSHKKIDPIMERGP